MNVETEGVDDENVCQMDWLCKHVLVTGSARSRLATHIGELTTVTMPIKHLESVYLPL